MCSDNIEDFDENPEGNRDGFSYGGGNAVLRSGLYLVATPIGNLRDITLRALDVLKGANVVLCEDTRVTRKLLTAYQIKALLMSCNDHSESGRIDEVLSFLEAGKVVALVSDAGMPMISDPGFKLVRAVSNAGYYVTSLPGANAPLSAIQLSAMPSDAFCFFGFFPNKTKARIKFLTKWLSVDASLVGFESAHRLVASLRDIHDVLGARDVAVVREITKMYEEVRRGKPLELAEYYEDNGAPRGEIVLVIAPPENELVPDDVVENMLRQALKDMKTKDAARLVAEETGRKKSELYDMAVAMGRDV